MFALIKDSIIDTDVNYNSASGVNVAAAWLGANNTIILNDVIFKGNNNDLSYYMLSGDGAILYLNNVICEHGTYTEFYHTAYPTNTELYCNNCDFTGTTINVTKGGCVNTKGTFTEHDTFINRSVPADIIQLSWIVNTSDYGGNVTDSIQLPAGCYIAEISYPTCDASFTSDLRNINDFKMSGSTGSRSMHIFKLLSPTFIALRALNTGINFTNASDGYVKIIRIR